MTDHKPATWERFDESVALETPWFKIRHTKYVAPSGQTADYWYHDASNGVLCVCLTADGKFLIEQQYRLPLDRVSIDFPAGHIEASDPSPEFAARREVEQETGFKPTELKQLAVIDKDPGFSAGKVYIFLARTVVEGHRHFDFTEDIKLKAVSADELGQLISAGKLSCAFCVSATFFAFRELGISLT